MILFFRCIFRYEPRNIIMLSRSFPVVELLFYFLVRLLSSNKLSFVEYIFYCQLFCYIEVVTNLPDSCGDFTGHATNGFEKNDEAFEGRILDANLGAR